jgi:hypothetical protein
VILARHRYLVAASIATIGAGMGLELLEMGGWIGPFIACIGVAVALFLAWDVPRAATLPNFHGHTTIQPLENGDDCGWLSTLPGW